MTYIRVHRIFSQTLLRSLILNDVFQLNMSLKLFLFLFYFHYCKVALAENVELANAKHLPFKEKGARPRFDWR